MGRAVITALSKVPLTNTRPTRVVLMYSGGLDSVALLANLLAATDHEIHVHHIVLDNGERRAGAENQAVAATYEWCRAHLRPFDTSESGHTFPPGGGAGGWDTTLTMFTAARVTRWLWESPIDVIVTGHIRSGFRELAEGETVFHAALQSRRRRDPEWLRPLARLTGTTQAERKADIARSIPAGSGRAILVVSPAGRGGQRLGPLRRLPRLQVDGRRRWHPDPTRDGARERSVRWP